jgi:hypothetical protein
MSNFALLTVGNPKIAKAAKFGWLTAVLHLSPGSLSGFNVCPKATAGCLAACLNTAGRGGIVAGNGGTLQAHEIAAGTRTNAIQAARIRRTKAYFADRPAFMAALVADVTKLVKLAAKLGLRPSIRLNGTSDIPWERVPVNGAPNIMALFPAVQFYDYTKRPNRRDLPANYRLTFSLAEDNDEDARNALFAGMNVAAVFRTVPTSYAVNGAAAVVIDGDEHDLRFLDPAGVIVGLKAKGNAKRDASGFVR